jgi:hypothetical protein
MVAGRSTRSLDLMQKPARNDRVAIDKNGAEVRVGDFVRVVEIPSDITLFNDEERRCVNSMLGEVFEVEEIDPLSCAEVTKWWTLGEGLSMSHSLNLSAQEMELVKRGGA